MRSLVLLLGTCVVAAGCLGGAGPGNLTPTGNETPADDDPGRLIRYDGNGTELAEPAATSNVTTWYNLTGHGGAEPTMGITASGAIFITGSDQMHRSRDGGGTWETVYTAVGSSDPLMDVDRSTDTVYMDPMNPPLLCTELAWSTDDGESWTTNPATCHPPPMDHQKLFVGPPSPDAPPVAGAAVDNVLYQCYNQGLDTACATSYDGGLTWANWQVVADQMRHGCGGINGFGAVGPNGTAAVPIASGCDQLHIGVTTDSGVSWTVRTAPSGPGADGFDPDVDFGPDGAMYVLWRGDDQGTYLVRSPDRGKSWAGPWQVTPPGATATMYPTMNVGADGRAAFAFLASETAPGPEEAAANDTWHLHIVTTDDVTAENPSFTSHQVTPDDDPVQVGRICTGGFGGCGDGKRNLLEFIDSAIHPDGTFYVVYTEGCVDDCAEDPNGQSSTSSELALAKLEGWTLERKGF